MLLRAMRRPERGGPSLVARLVAVLIVLGLLATVSPALLRAGYWLLSGFVEVVL